MNASIWGPKMWSTLFTAALRLPPTESVPMFETLTRLLPCEHCRRSFAHYCQRLPPSACAASSEDVAQWVWAAHDFVNVKLGRKVSCIPLSTVQTRHAVFTQWCAPFDAIDLLAIMALQVKTLDEAHAYALLAPTFVRIAHASGLPKMDAPSAVGVDTAGKAWAHAASVVAAARKATNLPTLSEALLLEQYELCRAPKEDEVPTPTKRRVAALARRGAVRRAPR